MPLCVVHTITSEFQKVEAKFLFKYLVRPIWFSVSQIWWVGLLHDYSIVRVHACVYVILTIMCNCLQAHTTFM